MRKIGILLVGAFAFFSFAGVTNAQTFDTVLDWMFQNGLTIYNTEDAFRRYDPIQRGEVAKNLTKFAEIMDLSMSKSTTECQFGDIAGYDSTLEPHIVDACRYGLVKGFQGNYNPTGQVTEAEMITIIVRALLGFQNENNNPRWLEYYEAAQWLGLLDGEGVWDLDTPATRWKVGTWLYRAAQIDTDSIEEEGSDELKAILTEIFGEEFWEE